MEKILLPIAAIILIVLIIYFGEKSTNADKEIVDSSPHYSNDDFNEMDDSDSDGACEGDSGGDGDCD